MIFGGHHGQSLTAVLTGSTMVDLSSISSSMKNFSKLSFLYDLHIILESISNKEIHRKRYSLKVVIEHKVVDYYPKDCHSGEYDVQSHVSAGFLQADKKKRIKSSAFGKHILIECLINIQRHINDNHELKSSAKHWVK